MPEPPRKTPCKQDNEVLYIMFLEEHVRNADVVHLGASHSGEFSQLVGRGNGNGGIIIQLRGSPASWRAFNC